MNATTRAATHLTTHLTAPSAVPPAPAALLPRRTSRSVHAALNTALPGLALALLLGAVFWRQPRAMSYFGVNLLLNVAIPIMFATLAQMMILAVSDLDLSIGPFVSLVVCIGATLLPEQPLLAVAALAGAVAVYALAGALIEARQLPSIVVTLGLSFVWLGGAVLLVPTPGGSAPAWLQALMRFKAPGLPLPIWVALLAAGLGHWLITRSAYGALVRGVGGNAAAVGRAGWSLLRIRAGVYAVAGVFGVCAGLMLLGQTTSADANIAARYTLVSIASVILGGGQFVGGVVSPVGAVIGAMTMTLAASFLTFLDIAPDWQIGMQGLILILVLGLRAGLDRLERRP